MYTTSLDILEKLISFESITNERDGNNQAIEYIDRFLSECGMHVMRYEYNGVESLVATTTRTKTPAVMLYGHVDVAPAEPEMFKLRRTEGKLVGRGVVDMKAAVAAYLRVVYELQDNLSQYDFGVMIVSDEEVGGFNGAQRLVEEEGYRPGMCIIPDGGANWALETAAKGVWFIDVVAEGTTAHSSRPWLGQNALEKLLPAIDDIKKLFPENSAETSTCSLSKLHAGDTYNQMPAQAVASFDIRALNPAEDVQIRAAVADVCKQHGVQLKEVVLAYPCTNDMDDPYLRSFADTLEKVIGYPTGTMVSLAGSDGRFFSAKGVPCAIFYPMGGDHHGPEEWISEEAFEQLHEICRDYLQKEAKLRPMPTLAKSPGFAYAKKQ